MSTITATQLVELWKRSPADSLDLIDVRSPAEYRGAHIAFARNIPLDQMEASRLAALHPSDRPLYVICQSGQRSDLACNRLHEQGLSIAVSVQGGMSACLATDLPIVYGPKVISIERQVRIAAGTLVLTGLFLGWLVHPLFFGLSAFIGGGLVFAGMTDTCGLGILLAHLPWNR